MRDRRSNYASVLLFHTATVESVCSLRYAGKDTQIVHHQVSSPYTRNDAKHDNCLSVRMSICEAVKITHITPS